jgi:hypothetical protein
MPAAPGGFPICFDAAPVPSAVGDWYSHYCDYLCSIQNANGSWSGYSNWTGPLATGWYINILNAVPVPPPPPPIVMDIKPGSCPNPLNVKLFDKQSNSIQVKGGVLPVAILGREKFDVTTIDVSSVLLKGVAPLRWNYDDVATPYDGDEWCGCTTEGPDGYTDLTLKFQKAMIAEAIGMAYDGQVIQLTITGMLNDGTPFEAMDCVWIRSKMTPEPKIATGTELGFAVPNPFNPVTRISYRLPEEDFVQLSVFDVDGKLIERLVAQVEKAGNHVIEWDAKNAPSGIYFYRLQVGDFNQTRKMILVK